MRPRALEGVVQLHRRRSASASVLRVLVVLLGLLALVLSTRFAHADEPVADFVGATTSGLPGIGRVAVASPRATPHVAAGLSAGYGLTESLAGETGAHHRAMGALGIGIQPLPFLAAALTLDGRYDKHPDDVLGSSVSGTGEPRLHVRGQKALGRSVALGAQLVLLVPGGEVPSIRPEASTLDGRALLTFAPPGADLALALNAGYRLDRTAEVLDGRPRLRPGDRITLGTSDFDAVLVGVGASKRVRRFEVLGEVTWDLLVGKNAPSAIESPLRAGAGARYHLGDDSTSGWQLEARSEVALGERAANGPTDAFVPIEPRFAVLAGVRWVIPLAKKAKPVAAPTATPSATPAATPAVVLGSVRGRLLDDRGRPIAQAPVTVQGEDGVEHTVTTDADGNFVADGLPPGRVKIVARASSYEEKVMEATVDPKAPAAVDIPLKKAIKPGQLRGLVRSFDGKPLSATVRVDPLGLEVKTDADGAFKVDVAPGAYQVFITAGGFAEQRRPVQVEENGVTILNADLRRGK